MVNKETLNQEFLKSIESEYIFDNAPINRFIKNKENGGINKKLVDLKNKIKSIEDCELKKFAKFKSAKPYKDELVVLVNVKIDNLKEFSKFILSKIKILESINTLMKKEIKIKKERFIVVLSILVLE